MRNLATNTGVYKVRVDGPGFLKVHQLRHGVVDLNLLGTTSETTLSVALVRPRPHKVATLLPVQELNVVSHQLGAINAGSVLLSGAMTPLANSVGLMSFGALGPGAQIDVNGDVGTMIVPSVDLGPSGHVVINGDLNGGLTAGSMQINDMTIDGGQFVIGRDSVAPISISGDLTLGRDGLLSIGRDQLGALTVGGTIQLDAGGEILVGRNLDGLYVGGDVLVNPGASGILVRGELNGLSVNGVFRGQGSAAAVDLGVGLDLTGFTVYGGVDGLGGIQSANVNVGKNLTNLYAAHGIFRSWITAGVSINNVAIGPDVPTAIYNSELDAVVSINNVVAQGDVKSDFPTNSQATGYPTRIIAGKARDGTFSANGQINDFQISGSLIDSVLAASVAPYGGRHPAAAGPLRRSPPDGGAAAGRLQQLQRPWRAYCELRRFQDQELLDPVLRRHGPGASRGGL